MRVATFNAGLAVGLLPRVTERVPHVVAALAVLDVDVLFVQEFWLDAHWEMLRVALRSKLPHVMRPSPDPAHAAAPSPCAPEDVAKLIDCARQYCGGLRDEALARCVVRTCAHLALEMPRPCLNCIAANPSGSLEDIIGRCVGAATAGGDERQRRDRYGGLIAYGGSFGTGLLSRFALEDRAELVYESSVNARGALHARLAESGIHVFATHFSPGGAEHAPQVEALARWIGERAGAEPAILLGDLNMSASSSSFAVLERAGFREPEAADWRGTYSSEGLETGIVRENGWRLDHVLVRGLAPSRTVRALDTPLVLADGTPTTLSDHFAVVATIG